MISPKRRLFAVLLLTTAGSGCAQRHIFANRVATPVWPDFNEKIRAYTVLSDRLDKEVAPLGDHATAEQMASHKAALGEAIRNARKTAKSGEVFTPSLRQRFIKVIRSEIRGASGRPARNTIREDNPNLKGGPPVKLVVNATYPDAAPLSTVPPTLLLRLPVLPKAVEYRFVGTALVLRDVRANVIVDYIPNALM